jgi:hypothetical protein
MEAVEDVDLPEWLQILEDEAAVLLAEAEENEDTGLLHKYINDSDGRIWFHAN